MTGAVIYVRQSLDRAGEGAAVARQEAEGRELAERNGWAVGEVYADNDASATTGVRPAWRRLLADVRAGHVRVVIAWHTDRLYRRTRDTLDLIEAGEPFGLTIATVRAGELDLSTPAGRMVALQLSTVARYEAEQKGDRQVAANRQRAAAGHVGWTRRPYGYDRAGGQVIVVPDEAAELRAAAALVLDGHTLASIAAGLNARDVRTTLGKPWTVTALKRLLVSPRHAGRAVSKGKDYGVGQWDAIFDTDTADRLHAVLTDPTRRTAPQALAVKYLLSGLAICGKCGGKMYASPAGSPTAGTWMIYRCRTQHLARRLDLVDELVEGVLLARLALPDAAALFAPDVDLDGLRAEANTLRERRDGLAQLLADGLLGADAVREQASALTAKLDGLTRQIAAATGAGPAAALVTTDDVAATWSRLTLAAKRDVVRTLIKVTVLPAGRGARFDPETVHIEWRMS